MDSSGEDGEKKKTRREQVPNDLNLVDRGRVKHVFANDGVVCRRIWNDRRTEWSIDQAAWYQAVPGVVGVIICTGIDSIEHLEF